MMKKVSVTTVVGATLAALFACSEPVDRDKISYPDAAVVSVVHADVETTPVASSDDAADDPAIWIHPTDPAKSLVIGTDKQAGLAVYNLQGKQVQFLAHGRPNNVDLRQSVLFDGELVDLVAFSDRATNSVGWASMDENGLTLLTNLSANNEPYGFCMGYYEQAIYAFVTYKTGLIEKYQLSSTLPMNMSMVASYQLASKLEGCVFDDQRGDLFVGEEETGIWKFSTTHDTFSQPLLIDKVDSNNGITADIEGMSIYYGEPAMLIVSSQGNDSFALYDLAAPHAFIKRFRILSATVDGAQETDGLDITATPLPGYPNGLLVVQDGFNDDGKQNFKLMNAKF